MRAHPWQRFIWKWRNLPENQPPGPWHWEFTDDWPGFVGVFDGWCDG